MSREQMQLMLELFQRLIWAVSDLNTHGEGGVPDYELEAMDHELARLTRLIKENV